MPVTALHAALSGIAAAHERVNTASHNVANFLTEDFRPLKTRQFSQETGGVTAETEQSPEPEEVQIAKEFVEADLAGVQAKASAQILQVEDEILGSLLDVFA